MEAEDAAETDDPIVDDKIVCRARGTGALPPVLILAVRRWITGVGAVMTELAGTDSADSGEEGGELFWVLLDVEGNDRRGVGASSWRQAYRAGNSG